MSVGYLKLTFLSSLVGYSLATQNWVHISFPKYNKRKAEGGKWTGMLQYENITIVISLCLSRNGVVNSIFHRDHQGHVNMP